MYRLVDSSAGVAEDGRDRRQRDRRAQQPGRGVVPQQPGAGLHIGHPGRRNVSTVTRWTEA